MITRTGEGQRPKLGLNWDITPEYFKLVWLWQNPRTCVSTSRYWRLRWKIQGQSGWAWKLFYCKSEWNYVENSLTQLLFDKHLRLTRSETGDIVNVADLWRK